MYGLFYAQTQANYFGSGKIWENIWFSEFLYEKHETFLFCISKRFKNDYTDISWLFTFQLWFKIKFMPQFLYIWPSI